MSSRGGRIKTRGRRREQQLIDLNATPSEHQGDQQGTGQVPVVPQSVSGPPTIDVDAIEDDDDVVIATASDFAQAKNKSRGTRQGPLLVDVESGGSTRLTKNRTKLRSDQANVDCDELNKSKKPKTIAPVEEPIFNCPICMCPFTEEVSTKCGHIFCKSCIKNAISLQAKCPTCRKKIAAKDLIRVFLPTTR